MKSLCRKSNCSCLHIAQINRPERNIKVGDELCLTGEPFLDRTREAGVIVACGYKGSIKDYPQDLSMVTIPSRQINWGEDAKEN
jgi:hypothetical protein